MSPASLLADCVSGHARLLIVLNGTSVPAAIVACFCEQADGSVACELLAAGGRSLSAWKHVKSDIEAWARFHGASSLRLCGRPGWERIFRDYRRRPLVSLVKDL